MLACLVVGALLTGLLREADVASPAAGTKVVLKFSHNQPTVTIPHQGAVLFKQLVEARTQGYYDVQIFPAQQLGGLRDQVEQTMLGTIEVTQQPAAILSLFVSEGHALGFPVFVAPAGGGDVADPGRPPRSGVAPGARSQAPQGGRRLEFGLQAGDDQHRNRSARSPISPGMKIRVIPSQLLSAQYEAWGASPTPVDFKELYTALEQGLVDGQENPAGTILDLRLYEVQKYMTDSRHGFLHYLIVFHKPWFDAQPPAHQTILVEAMREAGQWQRRATRERDAEAMQRLKEAGVHVQTLTEEAREQLRQRSLQVHAQFAERVGTDYLQRVYAAIAQPAP